MKKFLSALVLLIPTFAFSQISPSSYASWYFLQSGVVLGTEREQYYSIRSQTLGADLVGYVPDAITDLYRNPAYFSQNTKTYVFSEITQQSVNNGVRVVPITVSPLTHNFVYTNSLTSLAYSGQYSGTLNSNGTVIEPKIGFVSGSWGLFMRGNYSTNSGGNNSIYPQSSDPYQPTTSELVTGSSDGHLLALDVEGSYGFTLGPNLCGGASYTLSYNESPYSRVASGMYFYQPSNSYGGYDTAESYNTSNEADANTVVSNTGRFGLIWKTDDATWDGTVEFEQLTSNFSSSHQSASGTHEWQQNVGYPLYQSISSTLNSFESRAAVNSSQSTVDVRREAHPDSNSSFTIKGELTYSKFSAVDRNTGFSSANSTSLSSSDTGALRSSSSTFDSAPPDGSAYEISAGSGGTLRVNDALLAAAVNFDYSHIGYSYGDVQSANQSSDNKLAGNPPVPISTTTVFPSYNHDASFEVFRLVIPIGFEYEFLPHLQLRLGSYVQYVHQSQEMDAVDFGSNSGSGAISFGPLSSGLGYALSGRLQIDLLNQGDFTQPHNWNVAASYSF